MVVVFYGIANGMVFYPIYFIKNGQTNAEEVNYFYEL